MNIYQEILDDLARSREKPASIGIEELKQKLALLNLPPEVMEPIKRMIVREPVETGEHTVEDLLNAGAISVEDYSLLKGGDIQEF